MENNEWNPQYVYEKMLSEMDCIKESISKLEELIIEQPDNKIYLETAKRYCNKELNNMYDIIYEMASAEY